ncbi:C5a anaphylatoxin chemotactic receptor 1-like [Seriola lalandi dorsalis]|uniref:C5a anaphylatoxin chemotactic receptor 1-like n=1 Tax=Seriola lalandi dorsalis TaxID=1841481 RepID=UPI000C6F570A|nr:C5a anaphylatoxin chemotactic receptor 1-like [Seriola lalandi dorsalis]XP_056230672.1 C5a anaphylatoxin chemotactic receptor 1 [Seriola aureovittata]
MQFDDYENMNLTLDFNYTLPVFPTDNLTPEIQPVQIVALVFYGLVFLLGVPGNALVVWVTGFCMQRSVTSLWFLNLAVADLLCCLSIPLLMVPLTHDDHWHFGPLACTLVKGMFYLVMYCSVLQLVLISVDRWLMVSRPVWCQNNRRPKQAACGCVVVWCLALIGSIPQFVYTKEIEAGEDKRECLTVNTELSAWVVTFFRFFLGFLLPFLVIVTCHWVVYRRAEHGLSRGRTRSKRTLRVIAAVILSFFLCWLPLHIIDFLLLIFRRNSDHSPNIYLANILALCLAYFNSCLNPLLYVCLGRGFKQSMNRSLRNMLQFISEDPTTRMSIATTDTKSSSNGKEMTKI